MEISSWYEQRRNDLLKLIDESKSIDIPEKYADELSFVQKKCKENMFEIAFLGEFQGGKSTTFNALCDGRDLSPRGIGGGGIKTSAAVISAQNNSSDETRNGLSEWAEITYKTEKELVKITFDIVVKYSSKIISDLFNGEKPLVDEYIEKVKLSNSNHKKLLTTCIKEIWQIYEKDKISFSHDDLDMLRISTIIVKFFGAQNYYKTIEEKISPIDKFQKLVQFPIDWERKWINGFETDFTFTDISFVFVASVLLKIKSKNLARLGCRITDCPGLFANKYDTDVALDAIGRADAVLYLVSGERQIGDTCLKSIKYIKDNGLLDKIFISGNLRERHQFAIDMIIPTSQDLLKNIGVETKIHPYNARLAFLAMLGDILHKNPKCLTDLDRSNIIRDAESEGIDSRDVNKIWIEFVNNCGFSTKVTELRDIEELNEESLDIVRKHSGLEEILSGLECDIITKKCRSILYDNGSKKVVLALKAYEDNLLSLEHSLKENEDKVLQDLEIQKQKLENYIKSSVELIREEKEDSEESWAHSFVKVILDNAFNEEFFDAASGVVAEAFKKANNRIQFSSDAVIKQAQEEAQEQLIELVENTIQRSVIWFFSPCEKLQQWNDRNECLIKKIHKIWSDEGLKNECYLEGLDTYISNNSPIVDIDAYSWQVVSSILDSDQLRGLFKKMYSVLKNILELCIFPFKYVWDKAVGDPKATDEEKEKIKPHIKSATQDVREKFDEQMYNRVVEKIIEPTFNAINENVEGIIEIFKIERYIPAQENLKKTTVEKQAIIAKNNKIRTQQIKPIRERSEEFSKQIVNEMGEYKILDCDCVEEIKKSIGDTFSSKKTDNFMNVKAYFEHKLKVFKSCYPKHEWIKPKNEPYQIDGGWRQDFGNDSYDFLSLTCRPFDSNVFEVHGGIREKWINEGAQGGKYGWPMSDEIEEGNIRRSVFEHGSIEWSELAGHEANGSLD